MEVTHFRMEVTQIRGEEARGRDVLYGFGIGSWPWEDYHQFMVRCIAATVLTFCVYLLLTRESHAPRWPPGPMRWPIIGNLAVFAHGKLQWERLAALARKYGPVMYLKRGSYSTIVVSSPDLARDVLEAKDRMFASRSPSIVSELLLCNGQGISESPLDDHFRFIREIAVPRLLSPKRTEGSAKVRRNVILRGVERLLEGGQMLQDNLVPVDAECERVGFNTMVRVVFREEFWMDQQNIIQGLASVQRELLKVPELLPGDFFPILRKFDIGGLEMMVRRIGVRLHQFYTSAVKYHRQLRKSATCKDGSGSFLDELLSLQNEAAGITDVELKALLQEVLFGGVFSISSSIPWALAEILRCPDVHQKALEELDTVVGRERIVEESDLENLKYLRAIVKESLRLHPALPLLPPRQSIAPTLVGGYYVAAHTQILVNVYAIARDEKVWKNASAFDPDRFLNTSIDIKGHHFEVLPFGSGRRMCPGMNLGLHTVDFCLAQFLHTCDFRLPHWMTSEDVDMRANSGALAHRKTSLNVRVRPRLSRLVYQEFGITI